MRIAPSADNKRLAILNAADSSHAWLSCGERRRCILCERVFSGREVKLSWFRKGLIRLHCPTANCPSDPSAWVHPGNPLVSEEAWRDWQRIIGSAETPAS